jgi:hypothetical protein
MIDTTLEKFESYE